MLTGKNLSFIAMEFDGSGKRRLDIVGTTYLPEFGVAILVLVISLSGLILLRGRRLFIN